MCTLTGDIAKFAILQHARLCYRKLFLMKDFSTSTKSQHTIKNKVSQLGILAPLEDARKHSSRFKTAYKLLSCFKSVFIFGCSVSNFQRCYALVQRRRTCGPRKNFLRPANILARSVLLNIFSPSNLCDAIPKAEPLI